MDNKQSDSSSQRRFSLGRLWSLWQSFFDQLPEWMFAPDTESLHKASKPEVHEEMSKSIRRVFYLLVGVCLFCIITLAGSQDIQLLTPSATVKLPVLNYEMGFVAFLIVAPIAMIALTIYLHIFVGQQRILELDSVDRFPTLPNFSNFSSRLLVLVIFYWMVPATLAVFAWKAWPRPYGSFLSNTTIVAAAALVLLQFRRCPRRWRAWGLPLLAAMFAIFYLQVHFVLHNRHLNLFKANLSAKDLRSVNLRTAYLAEANLSEANLTSADLSKADLTGANLIKANLTSADLSKADLSGANLSEANLSEAHLVGADLTRAFLLKANLIGANLTRADLSKADLSGANLSSVNLSEAHLVGTSLNLANLIDTDLSKADLTWAHLSKANLRRANLAGADLSKATLGGANLIGSNLTSADLSKADLSGANLTSVNLSSANLSNSVLKQDQVKNSCGNSDTKLPRGFDRIHPCPR